MAKKGKKGKVKGKKGREGYMPLKALKEWLLRRPAR